ncbi:unnamed protein product [Schistocephalus solidus]|uniref:KH domain-containing protein n=1 Tax=Schistocephalus solidus TaxID=70667 RepID=A0A183SR07_SCHSO|nr:unnamed protein product [Schistocephalus solidus]
MSNEERKPDNSAVTEVLVREIQNIDENAFPQLKSIGENGRLYFHAYFFQNCFVSAVVLLILKVRAKVNIPAEQYPYVNFVGKLLGPGGKTLRGIQDETRTKMAILGAGSLRDEAKEKELLSSGDPKYQHLKQSLHLQIDALAPPAEAYYNISHALAQVRRVMLPVCDIDSSGTPAPPWAAGQGTPTRGSPGGRGGRGRGFVNQASYVAAMNFNNPVPSPTGPPMRGRGGNRGRGWASCPPPVNGNAPQMPPPPPQPMPTAGADCYGNSMEPYSYQGHTGYEQTEYDTTSYEDYSGAYGMFKTRQLSHAKSHQNNLTVKFSI